MGGKGGEGEREREREKGGAIEKAISKELNGIRLTDWRLKGEAEEEVVLSLSRDDTSIRRCLKKFRTSWEKDVDPLNRDLSELKSFDPFAWRNQLLYVYLNNDFFIVR